MTFTVLAVLHAFYLIAFSTFIQRKEQKSLRAYSMLGIASNAVPLTTQDSRLTAYMVRTPSGGGMTYDSCRSSVDCKGDRSCRDYDYLSDDDICTGEAECRCLPKSFRDCSKTADCETGEVCPRSAISRFCKSESYADDYDLAPSREGLTMSDCSKSRDCEPPRLCTRKVNNIVKDCAGRHDCRCRSPRMQNCTAHHQCPFGEVCATVKDKGVSLCLSEKFVYNSSELIPLPRKLTFDPCVTGKDCEKPRKCMVFNSDNDLKFCRSRSGCFCVPDRLKKCRQHQNCMSGEVCVRDTRIERRWSDDPYCVSRTYAGQIKEVELVDGSDGPVQTPTPTGKPVPTDSDLSPVIQPAVSTPSSPALASDNRVCIDVQALHGFKRRELVFETHQQARVLCDKYGSCATPGHVVLFHGRGMMMRSYCDLTSCEERVMMVNSPKYRRRLFVSSSTTGLQYTSLAARYETRGEEMLLTALIRVGI